MDKGRLAQALSSLVGPTLAADLAADFVKLRTDAATGTLERASPGKFVETFVQCLQQIASGAYDAKPNVDGYLVKVESEVALPEGLRLCAARLARFIYTLRNKRNIAHKNPIDPNRFDLAAAHEGAAWIVAELLRNASGLSMAEAGALVELVQAPVGTLVEEIDGTHLVHADVGIREEILLLLHSRHPERVSVANIYESLVGRSGASAQNRLSEMRLAKLIHGDLRVGYRLTQAGHGAAVETISRVKALA